MDAKLCRVIVKRLSFILRFYARTGTGEKGVGEKGENIRFGFYKASLGYCEKVGGRGTSVGAGSPGGPGRNLESGQSLSGRP